METGGGSDEVEREVGAVGPSAGPAVGPEQDLSGVVATDEVRGTVGSSADVARMRRMSRRSFIWAGIAVFGALGAYRWFDTRSEDGGIGWPFRRALETNEDVWGDFFSTHRLTPTYEESDITAERQNGDDGLGEDFDPTGWKLSVSGVFGHDEPVLLSMDDLKKLPHTEQITEFCCIEGWSIVQKWKGVRFADFAKDYPPTPVVGDKPDVQNNPQNLVRYVAMQTPDNGYYVGLDMASALHPQTLLCWEMNGHPLTLEHGAPLRLVIPVKYGVKNLKRIGTIEYTDQKPRDYWAEQGYDWYAGL